MLQILILFVFSWLLQDNEPPQFPYWDRVPDNEITWHPNGNHLAIATSHGLWVYNLQNDEASLISDCGRATFTPMFNHEGDHLAYNTNEPVVRLVDWITQTEMTQFHIFGNTVQSMVFDRERSQLVVASGYSSEYGVSESKIEVWDYQKHEVLLTMDVRRWVISHMQVDVDTDVLWVTAAELGLDVTHTYLWAVEMQSGNVILNFPMQLADVRGVRMDNAVFVYSTTDNMQEAYRFLIWNSKGIYNRILETPYDSSIYRFDITNSSERVAMITQDNRLRVMPLYQRRHDLYDLDVQLDNIRVQSVRFDPTGERLAIQLSGELPEVEIWDMETMTHSMTLRTADWYQADCGG